MTSKARGTQQTTTIVLPDRYLTPTDVSEILGVPVETLYQWRRKRIGPPAFRIGRHLRYDPVRLATWVNGLASEVA